MKFRPHVNSEFHRAIYHHIIGNVLLKGTESPLILGIFGPPGDGKTFQTEQVCKSLDVDLVSISPGELESPNAGQPGDCLGRSTSKLGTRSSRVDRRPCSSTTSIPFSETGAT